MQAARTAVLSVAVAGIAAAVTPAIGVAAAACTPTVAPADEARLAHLIDSQRRAVPVTDVARLPALKRVGRAKSLDMASGGAFSHASGMSWAGGHSAGQNIAMAPSATVAFRAMLNSPPHRRNMLAPGWRFGGVGAARDCAGQIYFTVNFLGP
jgi:uncharacterized protein YkwD